MEEMRQNDRNWWSANGNHIIEMKKELQLLALTRTKVRPWASVIVEV